MSTELSFEKHWFQEDTIVVDINIVYEDSSIWIVNYFTERKCLDEFLVVLKKCLEREFHLQEPPKVGDSVFYPFDISTVFFLVTLNLPFFFFFQAR